MERQNETHSPSLDDTVRLDDTIRLSDATQLDGKIRLGGLPNDSGGPGLPRALPSQSTSSDFAQLIPVNDRARLAFHEIAVILNADRSWNPHCRKFIYVSDVKSKVIPGGSPESDASEEDAEIQEIFTGYFRLNLTILPDNFPRGWVIGAGRSNMDHLGVDFLVTIKGNQDGVRGRHATIRLHNVSRLPMIAPAHGKKVLLNGEEVAKEGRVLESPRMGLTIGNLAFRIEFLPNNAVAYNKRLDEIVRESGWFTEKIESIDTTPSENHLIFHGYQIQTPQAFGAYGVVCPCIKISDRERSGNVYAVKRIQRTRSSFGLIGDEVEALQQLKKHPHICSLIEVIYSDGDGTSMGGRNINDVYMIFEPWAPRTLHSLMASRESRDILLRAFHQGAQGVRYAHSCAIIHRDLKPSNILVAQRNPLRVVISDFGHATTDLNSQDHMKGTISYLPPEIIQLKKKSWDRRSHSSDSTLRWSAKSDVFSYALVGFELLHENFQRPVDGIDKVVHNHLLTTLQNSRTAVDEVLEHMLAWSSDARPEMREVLLEPCWSNPETPFTAAKRHFPGC